LPCDRSQDIYRAGKFEEFRSHKYILV